MDKNKKKDNHGHNIHSHSKSVEILKLPSSTSTSTSPNSAIVDQRLLSSPSPENDGQSSPKSFCRNNRYTTNNSDGAGLASAKYSARNSNSAACSANHNHKYKVRSMSLLHKVCDVTLSLLLVFPLTIGVWRGIWQLMDAYSIGYGGAWLSLVLGNGFQLALYFFQEPLKHYVHPSRVGYATFYAATRFLLTLHSFSSINQWRGLWVIIDDGTEPGAEVSSAIMTLIIGIVISFMLKVFNNVLAPPTLIIADETETIHDYPLRFETMWRSESRWMYLCDCFFSVFVVQSLVIFSWRGLWNLADVYLYPDDKMTSSIVSLEVGYALMLVQCAVYPLYYRILTRCKRGFLQLVIYDAFALFGFISCVLAWRGLWELYNLKIVFDTPLLSEWVTTIVGVIGCALFGCVSSIAARGVTADCDLDAVPEWPLAYISLVYQKAPDSTEFPEPWLFRYFLTTQPVCSCSSGAEKRDHVRRSSLSPLNAKAKLNSNKPPLTKDRDEKHSNPNPKAMHAFDGEPLALGYPAAGLRNIDSSCDEEEMEMMVQHKP